MNSRSAERNIRDHENNLRKEINNKVLPKYKKKVLEVEKETTKKVLDCLDEKNDLGFLERLKCKEEVFKQSLEIKSYMKSYLNTINSNLQTCLDYCRSDLLQSTEDCYVSCLDTFKEKASEF